MNQKNDEKSSVPFVKSVLEFQNKLKFYEKVIFFTCFANIIFGAIVFDSIYQEPLVIMEKDGEKLSYRSSAKEIVITEEEIKKLVENFIKRRFEWEKFSIDIVMENLSPILSSGLKIKLEEELVKEEKNNKNQSFSQYVGKVNIAIDADNNIIGKFDKILRIHTNAAGDSDLPDKIPLLAEAQVMVKVVKGLVTYENPLGLYINSVINYEPR
jgi:hypothetical protein